MYKSIYTGAEIDAGIRPYKVYSALLSQSGTNAPIAVILENTIGNIVWARENTGVYKGTLTGAFTIDKTFVFMTSVYSSGIFGGKLFLERGLNVNEVYISQMSISQQPWDGFPNLEIEIRVYP